MIDGRPEGGGSPPARHETRRDYTERAELFKRLVDGAAADVAMEEVPYLYRSNLLVESDHFVEIKMPRREKAATYALQYGGTSFQDASSKR